MILKSLLRNLFGYLLLPFLLFFRFLLEQLSTIKPIRNVLADYHQLLKKVSKSRADEQVRLRYQVDKSVRWGEGTLLYGSGIIEVGQDTYFGMNCHVSAHPEASKIVIGKGCAISHNVHIRTASYKVDANLEEARKSDRDFGNIIISDNVWIGANTFIRGGISIGENSVIGANSVVAKDVPANAVFGGVPAKLIKYKLLN